MRNALKTMKHRVRQSGRVPAAAMATIWGAKVRLSEEERRLVNLASSGQSHPRAEWSRREKLDDVGRAEAWELERTIRAEVIEAILLEAREGWRLHHRGIHLVGARIRGELDLSFVELETPLAMNYCFFDSRIKIRSASVPVLELTGSRMQSLDARRVDVAGEILLEDVQASGPIELAGARIGGDLDVRGAKLRSNTGDALNADGVHIGGNVFLSDGFRGKGRVGLHSARVGGQVNCRNGTFVNPTGDAFNANASEIQVGVFMSQNFTAHGRVLLRGARLGGQLNCEGGSFTNPNDVALGIEGAEIDRSALLSSGFAAQGDVLLRGVRIGRQLVCTGGTFANQDSIALTADNVKVTGDVLLDDGFAATGEVRLVGARIGGTLNCVGGTFAAANATALHAADMIVGQVWLLAGARLVEGTISVNGASVGYLVDDVDAWPAGWRGDGFTFQHLGTSTSADVRARLNWLYHQGGTFRPGPYTQLAAVYRRRGEPEAARAVLIARERRRTDALSRWRRPVHWLWGAISAYGYRPWRAIGVLAVVIAVAGVVFASAPPGKLGTDGGQVTFIPWVYAADLAVPLIDLRQAGDYQPTQLWTQWVMWSTIVVGWVLSLAFAAAVTGIFKPDE